MKTIERKTVLLRDLCERINYGYTASATHEKIGPKFLRITDIVPNLIDWESVPFCQINDTDFLKYELQEGDIVIARTGATSGYAKRIKNPPKSIFASYLVRLRIRKSEDNRYIGFVVESNDYKRFIKANISGAAQPQANAQVLTSYTLSLPSLPIQHKIADILSAYDDLIENNTRRIAILEETAQMLYQEWFVKFHFPGHEQVKTVDSELGLIPEGWEVVRFFDIAEIMSGGTPKTTEPIYWNGDIPFYTPKDAPDSFFVTDTEKLITETGLKSCNSRLYPQNTVFITARGTVGRIALNAVDMAMNQSCYALKGRDGISQFFIFMHLGNCIRQLKQTANGAVFETIIVDTFKWLQVVKPPITLIDTFTARVTPIFNQILNLTRRNANLRHTRDMLLPKLVSGEIDVSSWVEGEGDEEVGVQELVVSGTGTVGVYDVPGRALRKVAEAGPVEPIKVDELEWRSLWE